MQKLQKGNDSRVSHCQQVRACICGGDSSDSDWTDNNYKRTANVPSNSSPHEQLHQAINLHNCRMIRQLLEDGVQPCSSAYRNSKNCFILAHKSIFLLKKFLEIEPSGVNCQDSDGNTMFMLSGNEKIFNFLCKYGPDVNLMNNVGDNILHYALKNYTFLDTSKLKCLLDLGLDVNAVGSTGDTALVQAVKAGKNASIIDMLIQRGATLPGPDEDGKTIVIHAVEADDKIFSNKIGMLKVLLKHGADASGKDNSGYNAMHYIIYECFESKTYWMSSLEKIIIMLLKHNCEVQGLDYVHERTEVFLEDDLSYSKITVKYDVISALVRCNRSIELLEWLLKRGLYSGTSKPNIMSPLSASLIQLSSTSCPETTLKFIQLAKSIIVLGIDVTQRVLSEMSSDHIPLLLEYTLRRIEAMEHLSGFSLSANHKAQLVHHLRETGPYQWIYRELEIIYDETPSFKYRAPSIFALTRELEIPDALFFIALTQVSNFDLLENEVNYVQEINSALEELLRLLLRFWPHPPLLLILLRVTKDGFSNNRFSGLTFMMRLLAKIGGPVPLGTCYYNILKSALQRNTDCKEMLDLLLGLDGGIPTLRNLSRAAFRATVKKTCATGLDFSEFRVFCQGKMVPLPTNVVKFLEFQA